MRQTETNGGKNSISDAFVFIVFGIFAVCIIAVLSLGISSYQKLIDNDDTAYQERTSAHYIYSKLRQAESLNGLYIESDGERDVLVIEEEIDGETYCTRIYCYDGWLRESFSNPDDDVSFDAGEKVLPAEALTAVLTDTLISIQLETADGNEIKVSYSLNGRKEHVL